MTVNHVNKIHIHRFAKLLALSLSVISSFKSTFFNRLVFTEYKINDFICSDVCYVLPTPALDKFASIKAQSTMQ